jgi:hypothetical protein
MKKILNQWIAKPTTISLKKQAFAVLSLFTFVLASSGAGTLTATTIPTPATGVGPSGLIAESIGTKYNGYLPCDITGGTYPWTLKGDFGTGPYKVTVGGVSVAINSSSPSQIVINPTLATFNSSNPLSVETMSVSIIVTSKTKTVSLDGVKVCQSLNGTIYHQCSWLIQQMRLSAKKTTASSSSYLALTTSWKPAVLDALYFVYSGGTHFAIITAVTAQKDGNYQLTICECNVTADQSIRTYQVTCNPGKGVYPIASFTDKKQPIVAAKYFR